VLTAWTFTALSPNHAVRIGVTRQRFLEWFAPGTQVLAQGYSRVGEPNRARARAIIRTDGQALSDLSYDSRATAAPAAPRMRCMTPADTKANAPPRTLSFDEYKQKYIRAPVPK